MKDRIAIGKRGQAWALETLLILIAIVGLMFWLSFVGMYLGLALAVVFAMWEASTGAALGKLVFGIKIKSTDGSPASFSKRFFRSLIKINGIVLGVVSYVASHFLLFLWPVDTAVTLFYAGQGAMICGCLLALGGEKQALPDRLTGTAVYPKDATA